MNLKKYFKTFLYLSKEALFPLFCISCSAEGDILCQTCYIALETYAVFACPVCGLNNNTGEVCKKCLSDSFLQKHLALGRFSEDSIIQKLLYEYKYNYVLDILKIFEKLIDNFIDRYKSFFLEIDFIVSVPLHRRRFAERGFNQADDLALVLASKIDRPVLDSVLKRIVNTSQQAKLTKTERQKNIDSAFVINQKNSLNLANKSLLLVDDVLTTGSTMQACARQFKDNFKAVKIRAFTLARG